MEQLKSIRRKLTRDKGKSYELNAPEPCFVVKYLGMRKIRTEIRGSMTDMSTGVALCARYVEEIDQDSENLKVSLLISTNIIRGLTICDAASKKELVAFQLHNIAFCTTDKKKTEVFSFIGEHEGMLECHLFDCGKEERANEICVALCTTFTTAHDDWSRKKKRSESRKKSREVVEMRNLSDAGKCFRFLVECKAVLAHQRS